MSEQKAGWYWVKMGSIDNDWEPVRMISDGRWASADGVHDDPPASIGPRIPEPDEMEGWQMVPADLIEWVRRAQKLMRALPGGGGWPVVADQADTLLAAAPTPGGDDA
tara:strand:+ start:77511 stop:77834 length:324 start_codon:yes stop_codon:yes gene_type:complete